MIFNSINGKNWKFKTFDHDDVKKFRENYSLDEIVAKLLAIRKDQIKNLDLFLNPTIKNLLPNPNQLKDMKKAVDRTFDCIEKKLPIGVFGDYDVDGATSTALLIKYFSQLKMKIKPYIPDRKTEGYGPSKNGFNSLINFGAKIIFTVDCGTSSFDQIDETNKKNVDVIVLDHHQSDIKLPNAYAIVNPNRFDDLSNLKYLCAAGVCFMFLVALNKKLREENWFKNNNVDEPDILNFLDLVSLGTVCDVVPLIDLNRAIVKQGLKIFKKRKNLGLKTLYDLCKIESKPTVHDLGFILGPRINAGGRVGKSSHGTELLICESPQKAYQIANDLNNYNKERQNIELILSQKINEEVKKYHNQPVLILSGENWHEGVIGIVAARIKDKFNKPTILISVNKEIGKGSARSIVGFDIGTHIINAVQSGILQKGGGHKMAGGFSILKKNIPAFREFMIKKFEKNNKVSSEIFLYLDTTIAPSALNIDFYKQVSSLGPYGSGNREPKFVIENLRVLKSNLIGKNHIKSLLYAKDGTTIKSFAWNAKNTPIESILQQSNKKLFTVAGKMHLNEWKGKENIEFIIDDISIN